MNRYQEFHNLKKDISMKLLTIQDGDRLDGVPDDFLETGKNLDVFNECYKMMQHAKELVEEIVKNE